jgi:hypothetical protein
MRRVVPTAVMAMLWIGVVSGCGDRSAPELTSQTSTSASATPAASQVRFKNGDAYCAAHHSTRPKGFVVCSARIGGTWQTVVLPRKGRALRRHHPVQTASSYEQLGTHWRGGPFLCGVVTGGIVCVSSSSHGFDITRRGITTR